MTPTDIKTQCWSFDEAGFDVCTYRRQLFLCRLGSGHSLIGLSPYCKKVVHQTQDWLETTL